MPRCQESDVQSVIENLRNLDALAVKLSAMQALAGRWEAFPVTVKCLRDRSKPRHGKRGF